MKVRFNQSGINLLHRTKPSRVAAAMRRGELIGPGKRKRSVIVAWDDDHKYITYHQNFIEEIK